MRTQAAQFIQTTVPILNRIPQIQTYSNRNDDPSRYIRIMDTTTGLRIGALYPEKNRYPSLTFNYKAFHDLPETIQQELLNLIPKFDQLKQTIEGVSQYA